jgi:hypothetical protein
MGHPGDRAVDLGDKNNPFRVCDSRTMQCAQIRLTGRAERHVCCVRLRMKARQFRDIGRLGRANRYSSSVDVVGPSASASYESGAQGLRPSSAPLVPSGSAGPSAGGPASS